MDVPLFYKNKPAFGLDIGHSTIKMVQLAANNHTQIQVVGYGYSSFSEQAIQDSVIVDFDEVAQAAYRLLTEQVIGSVTTNRVVTAVPVAKTFTRILTVPAINEQDLDNAVRLEVEQYVPMAIDDLYIDYEVTYRSPGGKEPSIEVLMVAVPRRVVDAYVELFAMLGLELSLVETSLISSVRGVTHATDSSAPKQAALKAALNLKPGSTVQPEPSHTETNQADDNPKENNQQPDQKNSDETPPAAGGATLLVDFGAKSSDLSIVDKTIRVTGTIDRGSDSITELIASKLEVTRRQAFTIKTRYGVSPSKYQKQVIDAIQPVVEQLIREVRKMQRYYASRAAHGGNITELIMLGGGANLPGLPQLLQKEAGIQTRLCDPWRGIQFAHLQEPHASETTMYTTAVGLALQGLQGRFYD